MAAKTTRQPTSAEVNRALPDLEALWSLPPDPECDDARSGGQGTGKTREHVNEFYASRARSAPGASLNAAIPVDQLQPNDYNPNVMTDAEYAELVAEVRHLGRLPKPIIVRANGAGYTIIDGEHGWRAGKEVGLTELPCEIIEVDDFEAMRQTYKRNQHGKHHKVREGKMFKAMMAARGLSQRELAKATELSEGTVRNALAYADAEALRNGYAFEKLGIRQVREYLGLPPPIGNYWLDAGADVDLLAKALSSTEDGMDEEQLNRAVEIYYWDELVKSGLAITMDPGEGHHLTGAGFVTSARRGFSIFNWVRKLERAVEGAIDFALVVARVQAPCSVLGLLPVTTSPPATPLISLGEWDELLQRCKARASTGEDWKTLVNASLQLVLREKGLDRDYTRPSIILAVEYLKDAPDFIRDANLDLSDKLYIWRASAMPQHEHLLEQAQRLAIEMIHSREAWLRSDNTLSMQYLGFSPPDVEKARADMVSLYGTAEKAFQAAVEEVLQRHKLEERKRILADSTALMDKAVQRTMEAHIIREDKVGDLPAADVLRQRLSALADPERYLLCALFLDDANAVSIGLSRWLSLMNAEAPSSLLKCAACSTINRVPAWRTEQGPKCGKCGAPLVADLPAEGMQT